MTTVTRIDRSMFAEIYESFLADDDPDTARDAWAPLFTHSWESGQDHYGYALTDGGRIVGILGCLFSRREIDGESRSFCNLHSWIVAPAHRGSSLSLMRPVLRLPECTVTDYTPTEDVYRISLRLGFRRLPARLRVLLPARPAGRFDVTEDVEAIAERLSDTDRRILRDHNVPACRHLLLDGEGGACYVVYTEVERYAIPYCHVHYISDRERFARGSRDFRAAVIRGRKSRFVAVDARLVHGLALPRSFTVPIEPRQLVRSSTARPETIDTLYSEVSLLRLTTFPDLSDRVRTVTRRWRGRAGRR